MVAAALAVDPANIYPIFIGADPTTQAAFQQLADGTEGQLFVAPTADEVVEAIIEAIGVIIEPTNNPPNCTFAVAEPSQLWPPNHKLVDISIVGVDDPDGDPVTLMVTDITQDEPVLVIGSGDKAPDGFGIGTNFASLRSERSGVGDGRIYEISFVASDGKGGECNGAVKVSVAHDQGVNTVAIDDGQNYDSTIEP